MGVFGEGGGVTDGMHICTCVIVKCDTVSIEHLQMTNACLDVSCKLLNFVFVLQDNSSPGLDSSSLQ